MTQKNIEFEIKDRTCDGCTKCCEGWLSGNAYGYDFWRGRPCHYLCNKTCAIYENRPEDPCKTYRCQWLINHNIPQWMKPDKINAILTAKKGGGFDYLELVEAGNKLQSEVLSWVIHYILQHNLNLLYMIDGGMNRIGSQEFLKADLNSNKNETKKEKLVTQEAYIN